MAENPVPAAGNGGRAPGGARAAGPPAAPAIERLTRALALAGGVLLLVAVAITLVSVAGRYGFSQPVPGDYELVELICAVAVFLFFPYTHAVGGNISALFFTSGLPDRYQRVLDLTHEVLFALIAALLTWRLTVGLVDKFTAGEASILIRIPLWWAFSFAVLSVALLTVVCLWRIAAGIGALRR
jgi:TRAP-type C4-dicarboxylate transport system permease small subunit